MPFVQEYKRKGPGLPLDSAQLYPRAYWYGVQ
jgi:hypothetical protein